MENPKETVLAMPSLIAMNQKPMPIMDGKALVVPNGMTIKSLKDIEDLYKNVPEYRHAVVETNDFSSFVSHVIRYLSDDTVAFATYPSISSSSAGFVIQTIMDYHPAGSDLTKAGAHGHKINYKAQIHTRMQRWLSKERKYMSQFDFAAFIEDNLSDLCYLEGFVPPFGKAVGSPADLLALSRGLEVRVSQTVTNAIRLSSGETTLQFSSENKKTDGSELVVPEWFGLNVPIFAGTSPVPLPLRLRYVVKDGEISFSFLFNNFETVLENAVSSVIGNLRQSIPTLHIVEGVI